MDATLNYPAAGPAGTKPLSERFNFRLIGFLLVVALPFVWVLWTIFGQSTIVNRGDYYEVDLKAMGNFPLDPVRDTAAVIPAEVRALHGKKVRFEGEMYAPDQAAGQVQQFQLVYSIVECCLGGPPKVQERVFAFVPPEKKIPNYTGRQVTVLGTLRVELQKDKGQTVSVFTMDVEDVQERT
jgi:hypothetical protein